MYINAPISLGHEYKKIVELLSRRDWKRVHNWYKILRRGYCAVPGETVSHVWTLYRLDSRQCVRVANLYALTDVVRALDSLPGLVTEDWDWNETPGSLYDENAANTVSFGAGTNFLGDNFYLWLRAGEPESLEAWAEDAVYAAPGVHVVSGLRSE